MSRQMAAFMILLGYCALLYSGQEPQERKVDDGSIRFIVCDTFGDPVQHFRIEISKPPTLTPMKILTDQSVAAGLPFGSYLIRVRASLFRTVEREVRLERSELLVLVGLTMPHGAEFSGESSVRDLEVAGSLRNLPSGTRRLWVRLIPVFGTFLGEANVESTGKFQIEGVPNGEYLLVVFQETRPIAAQKIMHDVNTATDNLVIDLAEASALRM